jgi:hypothetical protein
MIQTRLKLGFGCPFFAFQATAGRQVSLLRPPGYGGQAGFRMGAVTTKNNLETKKSDQKREKR